MKLQFPLNVSNASSLQDLIRFTSNSLTKIQAIINGNVDIIENGGNELLSFSFTKINSDVGVAHSLGRVPRGYINVGSNNSALGLANGATPNSTDTLYLRAGSTGMVTVMVF